MKLTKILWIIVTILLMVSVCILDYFISEDDLLIYAIMFLTFILILAPKMEVRIRIWNLAVYAGYNIPLLYCLHYKGEYGTSLYWWTFILLFNVVHLLTLVLFSVINKLKKKIKYWKQIKLTPLFFQENDMLLCSKELFDSIAPQIAEIRTVANSLPLLLK